MYLESQYWGFVHNGIPIGSFLKVLDEIKFKNTINLADDKGPLLEARFIKRFYHKGAEFILKADIY